MRSGKLAAKTPWRQENQFKDEVSYTAIFCHPRFACRLGALVVNFSL